jgi:hypothetical protein
MRGTHHQCKLPFLWTFTSSTFTQTNQQDRILEIKLISSNFTEFLDSTSFLHSRVLIKNLLTLLNQVTGAAESYNNSAKFSKKQTCGAMCLYIFELIWYLQLYPSNFNTKSKKNSYPLVRPQPPAILLSHFSRQCSSRIKNTMYRF